MCTAIQLQVYRNNLKNKLDSKHILLMKSKPFSKYTGIIDRIQ